MTTEKCSEEDFKKIVEDIRNELTAKLAFLSEGVDDISLPLSSVLLAPEALD